MGKVKPKRVLDQAIRLALRVEKRAGAIAVDTPPKLIAIGFLIRNRRLAEAISRLNTEYAYEARMLLRTMVEIMINHSWIRLKFTRSRAMRFIAYHPLELLRISVHGQNIHMTQEGRGKIRDLTRERSSVRHLFRFRDKNGKLHWARSWAKVESVEGRLREVLTHRRRRPPDLFLYTLYSWTSSAVHGGPNSLREVIEWNGPCALAKGQPESSHEGQFAGAAAILAYSIQAACEHFNLMGIVQEEFESLSSGLQSLQRGGN